MTGTCIQSGTARFTDDVQFQRFVRFMAARVAGSNPGAEAVQSVAVGASV